MLMRESPFTNTKAKIVTSRIRARTTNELVVDGRSLGIESGLSMAWRKTAIALWRELTAIMWASSSIEFVNRHTDTTHRLFYFCSHLCPSFPVYM
jgi:hypothetical protein